MNGPAATSSRRPKPRIERLKPWTSTIDGGAGGESGAVGKGTCSSVSGSEKPSPFTSPPIATREPNPPKGTVPLKLPGNGHAVRSEKPSSTTKPPTVPFAFE